MKKIIACASVCMMLCVSGAVAAYATITDDSRFPNIGSNAKNNLTGDGLQSSVIQASVSVENEKSSENQRITFSESQVVSDSDKGDLMETSNLNIIDAPNYLLQSAEENDDTFVTDDVIIPVTATEAGTVAYCGGIFNHGGVVCLKLEDGSYDYYYNLMSYGETRELNEVNISYGAKVEKGQLLGYAYETGSARASVEYIHTNVAPPKQLCVNDGGYISPFILQSYVDRGYILSDYFQEILDKYNEFIADNPDMDEGNFQHLFYPQFDPQM